MTEPYNFTMLTIVVREVVKNCSLLIFITQMFLGLSVLSLNYLFSKLTCTDPFVISSCHSFLLQVSAVC